MRTLVTAGILGALLLIGCANNARLPPAAGIGPAPALPPPGESAVPTIAVAPARGWSADEAPTPAPGLRVTAFARGLDHPRWLYVLPNGDVLVAESNAQPSPPKSLRDVVMKLTQGIAGAEVASPDRILLLRDGDGDGIAETTAVFLDGLTSPFGMALVGADLYVADTDALLRFPYRTGETHIARPGARVAALPAGEMWRLLVGASCRDGPPQRVYRLGAAMACLHLRKVTTMYRPHVFNSLRFVVSRVLFLHPH